MLKSCLGLLLFGLLTTPVLHAEALLSGKTKTWCFGRYLVDIPVEAELGVLREQFGLVGINSMKGDSTKFNKMVQDTLDARMQVTERNKKLNQLTQAFEKEAKRYEQEQDQARKKKIEDKMEQLIAQVTELERLSKDSSSFGKYEFIKKEFPVGGNKQLLISENKKDKYSRYYLVDAFVHPKGEAFFYSTENEFEANYLEYFNSDIRTIFSSIRNRKDDEFPSEPGFCVNNGFIADNGKTQRNEAVTMGFYLKSHPDIRVVLESEITPTGNYSLLESQKHAKVVESFPQQPDESIKVTSPEQITFRSKPSWIIKRVRAGERTVNGLPGEESLVYFPTKEVPGIAHVFSWVSPGKANDLLKPLIRLEILSGEGNFTVTNRSGENQVRVALKPSSLETEQIQELYEGIVKSIRFRPTVR
jgi:hypothetical protein